MFQARPNTWIAKISFCTEDGARITFENRFSPVRTTQFNYIPLSNRVQGPYCKYFLYLLILKSSARKGSRRLQF